MLERMYARYCDRKGYRMEVLEESPGEVAGIKSASLKISGSYAYGNLRTENGVHRLVRKSPFDSERAPTHLLRERFRLPRSGREHPGGSGIPPICASTPTAHRAPAASTSTRPTRRCAITHLPTGIVVQCQNDRSQHRNRAEAMAMLKSRLYELELRKLQADRDKL